MLVVDPRFGRLLREMRKRRGLSLTGLAAESYVSTSHISRMENGQRTPTPDVALSLDRALAADGKLAGMVTDHTADPGHEEQVAYALAHPRSLGGEDVAALQAALAAHRRLDDQWSAGALFRMAEAQHDAIVDAARDARGGAATGLQVVAAESMQFMGWLNAQLRRDSTADRLYAASANLAESVGAAGLASQSRRFRGSLAWERGSPRAMVRHYQHAAATQGAGLLHRIDATLRQAHGLALLGDRPAAVRTLHIASDMTTSAPDDAPPDQFAYWLTAAWIRFPLGLAHLELGQHADAAENLRAGLDRLPADQRETAWTVQYRRALERAEAA